MKKGRTAMEKQRKKERRHRENCKNRNLDVPNREQGAGSGLC